MARDDSHLIRQGKQLARKKAYRQSRDRILIVCEGTKTEPKYFEEIRKFKKLNTANVKIVPSNFPQPRKIIQFADKYLKEDNQWERVYLVFDRDNHPNFEEALKDIKKLKGRNDFKQLIQFTAIQSTPCFEIWFLLHFQYTTQDLESCDVVVKMLKERLPSYSKGEGNHFSQTREKLDTALENTKKLAAEHQKGNTTSFTNVDVLVEQLMDISTKRACWSKRIWPPRGAERLLHPL